jgi:hypothetical protein
LLGVDILDGAVAPAPLIKVGARQPSAACKHTKGDACRRRHDDGSDGSSTRRCGQDFGAETRRLWRFRLDVHSMRPPCERASTVSDDVPDGLFLNDISWSRANA